MATVCVDPDDFTTDSNGRLQIKTACGVQNTDDGLAVEFDPGDFTCNGTTSELQVRASCGITRTGSGLRADVAESGVFSENVESDNNILLANSGGTRNFDVTIQMDLRDWCDGTTVLAHISAEMFFRFLATTAGWDASVTASRRIDAGAFVGRGTLWTADNQPVGTFGSLHTIVDVISLTAGSVHNVTYRMTMINNSNIDVTIDRQQIIANALVLTRAQP